MIPLLLTSLMFQGPVVAEPAEKQFRIECVILQGDPLGSKEEGNVEVLAHPQLRLLNGQFGSYQIGSNDGKGVHSVTVNLTPRYDAASGNLVVRFQPTFTMPESGTFGYETTIAIGKPNVVRRFRLDAKSPNDQIWVEINYVEVKEKQTVDPKKK